MEKKNNDFQDQASAFYGMALTPEIIKNIDEGLTMLNYPKELINDDLVTMHLQNNFAYFGVIDKTLSGFVILDSQDDDYKLLDLRDSGQIYMEDHEERYFSIINDSLETYGEKSKGRIKSTAKRTPSTESLAQRYQWLVWFFAQVDRLHGNVLSTAEEYVGTAVSYYREDAFGEGEEGEKKEKKLFAAEVKLLDKDPHLAIYWLLHTTILMRFDERKKVLQQIANNQVKEAQPLLDAFVKAFGGESLHTDLKVLPDFDQRRAYFLPFLLPTDEGFAKNFLKALELAPCYKSLTAAYWIFNGLQNNCITYKETAEVCQRIQENSTGVELVHALIDQHEGKAESMHTDNFALAAAKALKNKEENFNFTQIVNLFGAASGLCVKPKNFVELAQWIRQHDWYNYTITSAISGLQKKAAKDLFYPAQELETDLNLATQILPALNELLDKEDTKIEELATEMSADQKRVLAQRILQFPGDWKTEHIIWAIEQTVKLNPNQTEALISNKITTLDKEELKLVIQKCVTLIDGSDSQIIDIFLAVVKNMGDTGSITEKFAAESLIETILIALGKYIKEPRIFGEIMAIMERRDSDTLVSYVTEKLFKSYYEKTYILNTLSNQQAAEVLQSCINICLFHTGVYSRAAAGHVISDFSHPVAIDAVFKMIEKYSPLSSNKVKEIDGKQLYSSKGNNAELDGMINNLYFAAGRIRTKESRQKLLGRLFEEELACWYLTSTISDFLTDDMHAEILKMIDQRHGYQGAVNYAFLCYQHKKNNDALADLLNTIASWPVADEPDARRRSFFKFALAVGIEALVALAKDQDDFDIIRTAYKNLMSTNDPVINPDQLRRGSETKNPLEVPTVKSAIESIVEGKAMDILSAAIMGDAAAVMAALERGENPNVADNKQCTPLHHIAMKGTAEVAEALIAHKATIEAKDHEGETPLYKAATHNNTAVLAVLLKKKAKLNPVNYYKRTALGMACFKNTQEAALMLINAGADLLKKDKYKQSPVQLAAENGGLEVVRKLISMNVPLNEGTNDGSTAIMWAAENGHLEIVKILFEAGADPLQKKSLTGRNAISAAKDCNHPEIVKYLQTMSKAYKSECKDCEELNAFATAPEGETAREALQRMEDFLKLLNDEETDENNMPVFSHIERDLVTETEEEFGIILPPSYKRFIKESGYFQLGTKTENFSQLIPITRLSDGLVEEWGVDLSEFSEKEQENLRNTFCFSLGDESLQMVWYYCFKLDTQNPETHEMEVVAYDQDEWEYLADDSNAICTGNGFDKHVSSLVSETIINIMEDF